MNLNFKSLGLAASVIALAGLAAPAQAQFGGVFGGSRPSSRTSDGCAEGRSRSAGSIAGSAAGRAGGVFNYVPVAAFTDTITTSIACKLDPKEQKQAADAT